MRAALLGILRKWKSRALSFLRLWHENHDRAQLFQLCYENGTRLTFDSEATHKSPSEAIVLRLLCQYPHYWIGEELCVQAGPNHEKAHSA